MQSHVSVNAGELDSLILPRRVRVLLFSTLYPSSSRPMHGIFVETRLRELLRTGEVETKVVAPVPWFPSIDSRWGDYARIATTPSRETYNGIDVLHPRYLAVPKVGMTVTPLFLAAASAGPLRRLIADGWDFDVIDAHYFYPDGVAAALLARWLGKPFTITARGTDLNLIPNSALPRRMIHWAAQRADASIGVCAALMDVLRGWGIADERLHVMRNGVDLQRFHPLPPAQARRALRLEGGPLLLSVGHLIERKGHHIAIEAMPAVLQKHPQARLLIVGEGPERGRLAALAQMLGLSGQVLFAGTVPNHELAVWYSAADLLVLASSREGWANVLLEAMACGTPVVATRIWGTPEVVTHEGVGRLVDERCASAFALAMADLLRSPPLREVVRRYAEGFSWRETSEAQLRLFRRIAQLQCQPVEEESDA